MTISTTDRPIVVGIDHEDFAAIRYALEEAHEQDCGLRIVHAYRLPVSAVPGLWIDDQTVKQDQAAAQQILDLARLQVDAEDIEVPVEYVLGYASATDMLTEEAKSARALVLGADDVSWFDRLFVGEVGSWLSTRADCPVIVVPASWPRADDRDRSVVVTLEGTNSSHGPLAYAFAHAERSGSTLHVLHVAPPGTCEDDENEERMNLATILAGWAELYPGVEVSTSITTGRVDESILRRTGLASLVVVGRPQRRGFPFSLARPTAVAVIKQALCPVVVVPSDFEAARR